MKRTLSALAAVAVSTATVTTPAFAAEPAASVDVSDGSSKDPAAADVEVKEESKADLFKAVSGLLISTAGALNGASVPEVNTTQDGFDIVLDPSSIPGLAEAFAPQGDHSGLTPTRGQDADGNTVVFPTSGTFTSGFGPRWGSFHNGIDVANPIGTPIYAVMDGEVISSGAAQGFGNWIRIQHDDGTITVYGHMPSDQLLVDVGDRVEAGDQISVIGNEGHSTGPHLHFEVHPGGGAAVDPVDWFSERGILI